MSSEAPAPLAAPPRPQALPDEPRANPFDAADVPRQHVHGQYRNMILLQVSTLHNIQPVS